MSQTKLALVLLALVSLLGSGLLFYLGVDNQFEEVKQEDEPLKVTSVVDTDKAPKEPKPDLDGEYLLWVGDRFINSYNDIEALKSYTTTVPNGYITKKGYAKPIFEQNKQYIVRTNIEVTKQFGDINEALKFARVNRSFESAVYYAKNDKLIWSSADVIKPSTKINLANIMQYPELPRGCEVTSLSMLLNAGGLPIDKMELAKNVRKDVRIYEQIGDETYWGSPYNGFVGDMYDKNSKGYGVYNQPIYELLSFYIPDNAVNLSGADFSLVERFVSYGYPVWVIITGAYEELPESSFETHMSKFGEIKITRREHSVLVTGYDSNFVYFNDPLGYRTKVNRKKFIESYNQMGKQAISYVR